MVSYTSPLFSSGKGVHERMMVVFSNLNSNLCMRIGRAEVAMKCSYPQSFVIKCVNPNKNHRLRVLVPLTPLTLINYPNRVSLFYGYVKCTFEKISGVLRKSAMNLLEHCTSTFQNPNTGLQKRKSCYLQDVRRAAF